MLSVIIIAKDEAANIRHCLESIQWVDEIIVLDSGSQDQTVAIAKEYTPKVFSTDWQGYGVQKQRALELATGDWVLNLDADEWVDDALRQAILNAITSNEADAYRIPIRMNFYGQSLRFSSSPKRHIRLFKRIGACYTPDIVHEKIQLPPAARVRCIRQVIMHNSFQDLSHVLQKLNRYSSYSAKVKLETKKPQGFIKTLVATAWMFFRCFVIQRGFLDGKAGFVFAVFNAQGTFYRGMKQVYQDKERDSLPRVIN